MNLVEVFNRTRVSVDEDAVARLVARVLEAEGVDNAESSVELVGERRILQREREHVGHLVLAAVLGVEGADAALADKLDGRLRVVYALRLEHARHAVSYTHLTLPTNREV